MSWLKTCVIEEKLKFIRAWRSDQYTITSLCEAFGISRPTGDRLIKRFLEEGEDGLKERSRRPKMFLIKHQLQWKMQL